MDKLKLHVPTVQQAQEEEIADSKSKRSRSSFKMLNIPVGETISFLYNENIVAKVLDDKNRVEFEGEDYSVSSLARKILIEKHGWVDSASVNGWKYFTKDGIILNDLRDRLENTGDEN